jgi:5-methylcytosine-specific restriction endonuclease McrA
MTKPNPDRKKAIEEGRKIYVSGCSCKKCGCVIKYVSSYGCHYCNWKKGLEKLATGEIKKYHTKEKTKKRLDNWRKNNLDKYADQWRREPKEKKNARAAIYRYSRRDQTPDLTDKEKHDIIEVYKLAQKLTIETGIKHEVDHIFPVSRGGLHHPDNLQVLTKHENASKGNKIPDSNSL